MQREVGGTVQTRRFVLWQRAVLVSAVVLQSFTAEGAQLRSDTLEAWQSYLHQVCSRNAGVDDPLLQQGQPAFLPQLQRGDVFVRPLGGEALHPVPGGLIHHWVGAAWIAQAHITEILAVVQDYDHYQNFYGPLVIPSARRASDGPNQEFSLLMINRTLFFHAALEITCRVSYEQASRNRWYSVTASSHIQKIEHFGEKGEHQLPPGEGSGYIWRIYSTAQYEQEGGVLVQLEAVLLSREIPAGLHWLVEPMVNRVARASLTNSLVRMRQAVQQHLLVMGPKSQRESLLQESISSLQ